MRPAFEAAGLKLVEIDWRAPLEDFADISLVLLGTAWDYQDHFGDFVAKLEALEARGIRVCNPSQVVRWNGDKRYLKQLGDAGVTTIPTLWFDEVKSSDVAIALDAFEATRVVVKRQIGAGGLGQHSFGHDALPQPGWRMGQPAMIQPFLPSVVEEGEYTFVFIDGEYSHGVLKRAAEGEYRIQSLYGGIEHAFEPQPEDLAQASAVFAALPFDDMLYCRVDMARLPSGELAVMEAEAIEPYLYPEQASDLGERMAAAVTRRLQSL